MRYVKAFVIAAPVVALLAHYTTSEPMPWWPDTFVFGAFMGAFAAFLVMRLTFAWKAMGHLGGAGRALLRRPPRS